MTPLQRRKYYIRNLIFKIYKYKIVKESTSNIKVPLYLQHILPRMRQFNIYIANNNYINHCFRATTIRMWNKYLLSMKTDNSLDLY